MRVGDRCRPRRTSSFGLFTRRGRRRRALTAVNTSVFAPIPTARSSTTKLLNRRVRLRERATSLKSRQLISSSYVQAWEQSSAQVHRHPFLEILDILVRLTGNPLNRNGE